MVTLSPARVPQLSRTLNGLLVLVPRQGDHAKWILKSGRWTIGSAATCAYRLNGDGIQLRHAVLVCGPKSVALKTWDVRTWLNGEPVCGEVRLRVGDAIKLGTITLDVMDAGADEVLDQLAQLPEFVSGKPMQNESVASVPTMIAKSESARQEASFDADLSIVEELRQQIHELRSDVAKAFQRPDQTQQNWDAAQAQLCEARATTAELQYQLETVRANEVNRQVNWDRHATEWLAERDQLRSELVARNESVESLRSETAKAESARQSAVAQATADREQLQAELDSLSLIVNQQSHQLTQLESAREAAVTQLTAERAQLQSEVESLRLIASQQSHQVTELESAREAAVARLSSECEQLQSEIESLRTTTDQLSNQVTDLESAREIAVAQLAAEREQLRSELESLGMVANQQSHQLTESESAREAAVARLTIEREQLQSELKSLRSTAIQLTHQLSVAEAARQGEAAQLHFELERREAEIRAEKQQSAEQSWSAERQQFEVQIQQLAADQETLKLQLDASEAERARLENELTRTPVVDSEATAAKLDIEQQQQELSHSREELQATRVALLEDQNRWLTEQMNTKSAEVVEESTNNSTDRAKLDDPWEPPQVTTAETESQPIESQWSATETVNEPAVDCAASVIPGRPAWATSLLAETNLDDDWSLSATKSAPATSATTSWETENKTCTNQSPLAPAAEAPVQDLRAKLAAMFDLPGLTPPLAAGEQFDRDEPAPTDHSEPVPANDEVEDLVEEVADDLEDQRPTAPIVAATEPPACTPLSFNTNEQDGEDVDDSVTRYMQGLLARARGESANVENFSEPVPAANYKPDVPVAVKAITATTTISDDEADDEDVVTSNVPVHQQDHDALRTATAQMRQVANLHALHNVKQHSRKRIYSSFKIKIALATFAFLLGLGFFGLSYRGQPAFIVLGGCAMCIGILTWIDMFIGIRESRERSAGLSKRTQANDN